MLLLQRNELLTKKQKWLRKKFGRLFFTNIFINFYQDKNIETRAEELFLNELNTFKKFLPIQVNNIMDIGCGLGIINVNLNKIFKNSPYFFLLDKNRVDKKIKYGFSKEYESYNNLDETKNILINNDINKNKINIIDVEKKFNIENKIDLVISLKSMGYHYPFEEYIDLIRHCCTENTIFIFDTNETQYKNILLNNYFKSVKIIYEEESIQSLKRLYCKNFIF